MGNGQTSGPRVLHGSDGLRAAVGQELGVGPWTAITQDLIDGFAHVTGDDYWLHADPQRAALGPWGGTIAHGLLTLSLGPPATYEIVTFAGFAARLNYGYDRVRFVAPVPVGSEVRLRLALESATEVDGGWQAVLCQTYELRGADRPACVARAILRLVTGEPGEAPTPDTEVVR